MSIVPGRLRPLTVARGRQLQGSLKIAAAILEQSVAEFILKHLGLRARALLRSDHCRGTLR
jgi:hypothetical protein